MQQFTIQWAITTEKELPNVRNVDFVALANDHRILYISHVNGDNLPDELRKISRQLNIQSEGLEIWVGGLSISAKARINDLHFKVLDYLLVHVHNPLLNVQVRAITASFGITEIQNLGFSKLYRHVRLEDGRVFRRHLKVEPLRKVGRVAEPYLPN